MSSEALAWLASTSTRTVSNAQFRVLFHLCFAHNSTRDPEAACFPSQERLREATGLSNGGLNGALKALEAKGYITRVRATQPGTAVRRTFYILGPDQPRPQEQTPLSGEANSTLGEANSTFEGGKLHAGGVSNDEANSTFCEANSTFEASKLHPGGVDSQRIFKGKPGAHTHPGARARDEADHGKDGSGDAGSSPSAPGTRSATTAAQNNPAQAAGDARHPDPVLRHLAEWVNSGRHVPPNLITNTKRDALLAAGLVTRERLREIQIY